MLCRDNETNKMNSLTLKTEALFTTDTSITVYISHGVIYQKTWIITLYVMEYIYIFFGLRLFKFTTKLNTCSTSYVYWTVHHVESWIKIDQLDVTCFIISLFTAQYVSNVSTSIFRSLRLIVELFHVLHCSGSICVDVTVWFGWGGVVSLCRLKR